MIDQCLVGKYLVVKYLGVYRQMVEALTIETGLTWLNLKNPLWRWDVVVRCHVRIIVIKVRKTDILTKNHNQFFFLLVYLNYAFLSVWILILLRKGPDLIKVKKNDKYEKSKMKPCQLSVTQILPTCQ